MRPQTQTYTLVLVVTLSLNTHSCTCTLNSLHAESRIKLKTGISEQENVQLIVLAYTTWPWNWAPDAWDECNVSTYEPKQASNLLQGWTDQSDVSWTKQWLIMFLKIPTPTTFLRSWLTPHSHNLGLNQCKSQFLKNLICCFFTWKSNLDILKWSNCHKISGGGY